jgi:RecB family exonuclease
VGLRLIVGPANSGRSGELIRRVRAELGREPILVVPTASDVAQIERDLCADGEPVVGVTVTTFAWLFADIAAQLGIAARPPLRGAERIALVRAAVEEAGPRALGRSARRPGFAPAMLALIDELEAALVDPPTLAAAAAEIDGGEVERELAAIHAAYRELREAAGRSDAAMVAERALAAFRRNAAPLVRRPLALYGFDDLTRVELELVVAAVAASEVTIAVDYADRAALAPRAKLLGDLREAIGADEETLLDHDPGYCASAALGHVDRHLFERDPPRVEPDGGIVMLECAGERGEAEAIALEIARLVHAGVDPGDVAIAVRRPGASGPVIARTLAANAIPAALEAAVPLAQTGVGRSILALCRAASAGGTPEDLLAHLRSDPGFPPSAADWLERRMRRGELATLDDAIAGWRAPPVHLARLRAAAGPRERLHALGAAARAIAEAPHRGRAPVAGGASPDGGAPLRAIELRAGAEIEALAGELASIGELPRCRPPDVEDLIDAVEGASLRAWRGASDGRVRILSPYRLRSARARYVFCASLQEGEFPLASPRDPLLSDERRAALGLAALRRGEPVAEERYLFSSCVSRPTERLYLSWRNSDDDGVAVGRSPFIDDVLDLLAPDAPAAEARVKRVRGAERVLPAVEEAPTERALARALTARGERGASAERLAQLGIEAPAATRVAAALAAIPDPAELPGPLRLPAVLGDLGGRGVTSANSLERWLECPYRWFVDHELQPQRLDPEADPLWLGSLVHDALERLYAEAPGADSIPRPGDVAAWKRRFAELLDELAGNGGERPPDRAALLARARAQGEAFLEAEAASETELRPHLLEWEFGFGGEGDPPPLRIGKLALRGRIDRIDLAPDRSGAVVRDYKTGGNVSRAGTFAAEGTLQIQLYMRAVRELLELEPVAGLYQPLGAANPERRRPRGLALRGDERLAGLDLVWRSDDVCAADDLDAHLEAAAGRATTAAAEMSSGDIGRRPIGGRCPAHCTYQAICRLERAVGAVGIDSATEEDA